MGSNLRLDGGVVTVAPPDDSPPPKCVQLRIIGCNKSQSHQGPARATQYLFSCLGRLSCPPRKFGSKFCSAVFSGAAAWSAGLPPRFNSDAYQFNVTAGDPIGAISKSDDTQFGSGVVRNWWPGTNSERQAVQPRDFWAPDDAGWHSARPYEPPRTARGESRAGRF